MAITKVEITLFLSQVILIVLYGVFAYNKLDESDPQLYGLFQDVNVMIFVGFGYLMVFLKHYSWTSVGMNYFIAAWCVELCVFMLSLWALIFGYEMEDERHFVKVDILQFINGDFGAGAVLISFGVLLGKFNFFQIWTLATIEIIFYTLNFTVIAPEGLNTKDIGGSISIHMFGACFGLTASFFYDNKNANLDVKQRNGTSYNSSLIAMIGTLFLFMYWPSFNSAPGEGLYKIALAQHNTIFAITASVITAVLVSRMMFGKLNMEIMLNATLAGGVVMGSSADLIEEPFVSILVGSLTGMISAYGFGHLGHTMKKTINLADTCGVLYLHGIPGFLGGFLSLFYQLKQGQQEALNQLWGILVTLGISILGGLFAGAITTGSCFDPLDPEFYFDDEPNWTETEILPSTLEKSQSSSNKQIKVYDAKNSSFQKNRIENPIQENEILHQND